jgi:hypothetical protein
LIHELSQVLDLLDRDLLELVGQFPSALLVEPIAINDLRPLHVVHPLGEILLLRLDGDQFLEGEPVVVLGGRCFSQELLLVKSHVDVFTGDLVRFGLLLLETGGH